MYIYMYIAARARRLKDLGVWPGEKDYALYAIL